MVNPIDLLLTKDEQEIVRGAKRLRYGETLDIIIQNKPFELFRGGTYQWYIKITNDRIFHVLFRCRKECCVKPASLQETLVCARINLDCIIARQKHCSAIIGEMECTIES